jgi:hypothetical protein
VRRPDGCRGGLPCPPPLPAALLVLLYKIVTFKRWSDEYPYVIRFSVCILLMIVELLWENVMVW